MSNLVDDESSRRLLWTLVLLITIGIVLIPAAWDRADRVRVAIHASKCLVILNETAEKDRDEEWLRKHAYFLKASACGVMDVALLKYSKPE